MCGINIIIDKSNKLDDSSIRCMNKATTHRGPDVTAFLKYYKNQTAYVGNNRLKINDLSDVANQPMVSEDGRYILSYNGELYNFKELKQKYLSDYSLKTSSDTEVLLYLLIKQGQQVLPELNGMFVFAFYDSHTEKLVIARDTSGIKPVYYYNDENYFIASSELKGVLASRLVEKKLNAKQIPYYLQFKYVKKPETFYLNIFELEEGNVLEYERGASTIKKYNPLVNETQNYSDDELITKVDNLLQDAVQRQLHADVPCGLFLSGGVDSTLLLALIREQGIKEFPVFSIVNSEKEKSFGTEDFYYASLAAEKYDAEHHQLTIEQESLHQLPEFINDIDQPIGDGAAFLTYLLSRQTSKYVKVILTGAGADELFAGYNRHEAFYYYLNNFYNKDLLISIIKRFSGRLPSGFNHPLRKQFRLLNKFLSQLDKNPTTTFTNFCSSEVFGTIIEEESNTKSKEEWLRYGLQRDRHEYLISDILALTDTMTMSSSLEARVPYLDAELISFVNSMPSETLLKHGKKWILKELLNKRDGQVFTERIKEGFGMPFGSWIREEQNILKELTDKDNLLFRYVDYEEIKQLVTLHLLKKKDYSSELWSLLVLALWLKKEFA